MARVHLQIEAEFLGPFGGETVAIEVESEDLAQRVADALSRIEGPKVTVRVER